jgi:hypothetical protein
LRSASFRPTSRPTQLVLEVRCAGAPGEGSDQSEERVRPLPQCGVAAVFECALRGWGGTEWHVTHAGQLALRDCAVLGLVDLRDDVEGTEAHWKRTHMKPSSLGEADAASSSVC